MTDSDPCKWALMLPPSPVSDISRVVGEVGELSAGWLSVTNVHIVEPRPSGHNRLNAEGPTVNTTADRDCTVAEARSDLSVTVETPVNTLMCGFCSGCNFLKDRR